MLVDMLKSKIHGAVVTRANIHYNGSITIDKDLLVCSKIKINEMVMVVNKHNGHRLWTYVFEGESGSRAVELNGAAARLCDEGDELIIISHCLMDEKEADSYQPIVVFTDKNNEVDRICNYVASSEGLND